jgi:CRISPR-associated protein Cmr1
MIKKLEYDVRFVTPAFLGNAEQQAQWRTPPFKALLRQWWRIAVANTLNYDFKAIRVREGQLFGHAWLEKDIDEKGKAINARKSDLLIRIDRWNFGSLDSSQWPGGAVRSVQTGKKANTNVRADLYLGFGPVLAPSKKEGRPVIALRGNAIPDSSDTATLKIGAPEIFLDEIERCLVLANLFGTLGSRSRNGWGSFSLVKKGASPGMLNIDTLAKSGIFRKWEQCMELDWQHAIGEDSKGALIWLTQPKKNWRDVVSDLASLKIKIRARAKEFRSGCKIGGPHLLGYPAGASWKLNEFSKDQPNRGEMEARSAAQIRFKVHKTRNSLVGVVFHLPAKTPSVLRERLSSTQRGWLDQNESAVWESIHQCIDNTAGLRRLQESIDE